MAETTTLEQRGIHPVLYTFFNADSSIDTGAIEAEVDWTIEQGAHGIVTLGIASEVAKLDVAERRTVMELIARRVAGRRPLGVTVAEPSVPGQIEFVKRAKDVGADWVILQSPQVKVGEAALVDFTAAVADSTDLAVAVQSNPGNMDVALSNAALLMLHRRCPNIRLLKAEGTVASCAELAQTTDMAVFGGRNGLELPSGLAAGFAGNVPAPEFTAELTEVFETATSGTPDALDRARVLHRAILPAIVFINHNLLTQLAYGKRLLAERMGLTAVHDRAPTHAPSAFGMAELAALVRGSRTGSA